MSADLDQQALQEFRDAVEPRIEAMQQVLDGLSPDGADFDVSVQKLLQFEVDIRTIAYSHARHTLGLLSQRFYDYLTDLKTIEPRTQDDIQVFLDRMREVLQVAADPEVGIAARILRGLPVHQSFRIEDIEIRDVEVLLVTPSKTVAKMAGAEIAACGFRVNACHSSLQAFVTAIEVQPDFIIAQLTMDKLSGLDLIKALKATSLLKDVPMAIMTSRENAESMLAADLPKGVSIVHSGTAFAESFAEVVTAFNLG